jgi:hypothetical protein
MFLNPIPLSDPNPLDWQPYIDHNPREQFIIGNCIRNIAASPLNFFSIARYTLKDSQGFLRNYLLFFNNEKILPDKIKLLNNVLKSTVYPDTFNSIDFLSLPGNWQFPWYCDCARAKLFKYLKEGIRHKKINNIKLSNINVTPEGNYIFTNAMNCQNLYCLASFYSEKENYENPAAAVAIARP